jgi:hypothetical protein
VAAATAASEQRKRAAAAPPFTTDHHDGSDDTLQAALPGAKKLRLSPFPDTAATDLRCHEEQEEELQQVQHTPKAPSRFEAADMDGAEPLAGKKTRARDAQEEPLPFEPLFQWGYEEEDDNSNRFRKFGTAGQLKKIRLVNFICHANFEMEFA